MTTNPDDWSQFAKQLGEQITTTGPTNYYGMSALGWYLWASDEIKQLRTELEAARAKLAEYEARDKKFIESINIAFEPKEKQP